MHRYISARCWLCLQSGKNQLKTHSCTTSWWCESFISKFEIWMETWIIDVFMRLQRSGSRRIRRSLRGAGGGNTGGAESAAGGSEGESLLLPTNHESFKANYAQLCQTLRWATVTIGADDCLFEHKGFWCIRDGLGLKRHVRLMAQLSAGRSFVMVFILNFLLMVCSGPEQKINK